MPNRKNIFVSYSHKDQRLFEEFQTMMAPAIQNGIVDLWNDQKIPPGAKWQEEIQKALASASVAVLLVSQNFLASHFITEQELPPLLKAAREEGVTIFWIYLSARLFTQTEIASYQAAHDPSRPLDCMAKPQRQTVLSSVCAKLIQAAKHAEPTLEPAKAAPPAIDSLLIGTWEEKPGSGGYRTYSFRADGTCREVTHNRAVYTWGDITTEGSYTLSDKLLTIHGSRESWDPIGSRLRMGGEQLPAYSDKPIDETQRKYIRRLDAQTLILAGELGNEDQFDRVAEPKEGGVTGDHDKGAPTADRDSLASRIGGNLQLWLGAARVGDSNSMFYAGLCYDEGWGVTQDYTEARNWYEKAAAVNNPEAMINLGLMYEKGNGVPQDFQMAREWYEKSAGAGYARAMCNLGFYYVTGKGVPQDYQKAREWYEKGADAGEPMAWRNLGVFYENGWGVAEDHQKALELYEKSAAAGDAEAMRVMGLAYENGADVPQDYERAREWYEKSAAGGNTMAMGKLGVFYDRGMGVPQSYQKARDWFQKSADGGNAVSMTMLGSYYETGQGVPQDYQKAFEWYQESAAAGEDAAMAHIGLLYEKGLGRAPDCEEARKWYEKSAATGNCTAMGRLGLLYANGKVGPPDYGKAREWWNQCAEKGNAAAMRYLGQLYENGLGVPQDHQKAQEWYEKAAAGGDAEAKSKLEGVTK